MRKEAVYSSNSANRDRESIKGENVRAKGGQIERQDKKLGVGKHRV